MLPFTHHRRDFNIDSRLLVLCAIAIAIGLLSTAGAWLLLALIRLFTNLFFYQTFSIAFHSPSQHTLGAWVIALPVIGGLLVGVIARFGTDKIRGHGIPEAIEAILYRKSILSPKVAILKPLASGIAIGSGGPFGAEGPIIMTGGAIGSMIAQGFSLSAGERKTLLVAGATAGMTAVFGTPLAAVLLAVELLLFEWRPRSLLPVMVACVVAGFARPYVMDGGPMFPLAIAPVDASALGLSILCGLVSGLAAAGLSSSLYRIEDFFAKLPVHWAWWPALGGLVVGIGGYLQPRALGVGYDVIADLLNNRLALMAVLALVSVKAGIWLVALASGTSGGVLAPLLIMGAGVGAAIAHLFPGSSAASLWPLLCMAAILSGAVGIPLTATVFAIELIGDFGAVLPLLLACGVAHGLTVLIMRRSIMTERISRRGLHIHREYSVDPHEHTAVHEVMTQDPVCIPAQTSLTEAYAHYFGDDQAYRHYPVVAGEQLIGIMDRDLLRKALGGFGGEQNCASVFQSIETPFALADDTCQLAARRMAQQHLPCLAVVKDAQSRAVIGILSRSDLVKPAYHGFHEEEVKERLWGLGKGGP